MGATDHQIIGGQFSLRYDPDLFDLVDVSAGVHCDPDSPFANEISEDLDASAGEVFFAAGVSFLKGGIGTSGPATLACLSFLPLVEGESATDLCLLDGAHPLATIFVDKQGHSIPIDNSIDCPTSPPPLLACDEVVVQSQCMCTPDTEDCHALDTDCRVGVCNDITHFCGVVAINEGGPCDDNDACTPLDRCANGTCIGTGCETSSLCPSSGSCLGLDPILAVAIRLTAGDRVINGAQFSFQYDPLEFALLEVLPGIACDPGSPFVAEVARSVDEGARSVFYAVGVELGGPGGTAGPSTIACVRLVDLLEPGGDVCMFNDVEPLVTRLVDSTGFAVPAGSAFNCPVTGGEPLSACAGFETCAIPTVSEWGLLVLALLLLIGAKVCFARTNPLTHGAA